MRTTMPSSQHREAAGMRALEYDLCERSTLIRPNANGQHLAKFVVQSGLEPIMWALHSESRSFLKSLKMNPPSCK